MSFQQKPNSGAIFPNDKKEKDGHPDMKGDFNIDGVNYWIAGWWKQGKRGEFLSISVEKKKAPNMASKVDEKPARRDNRAEPPPADDFPDESLPF